MPLITYTAVIFASWAAFILVWAVAAFNTKRDIHDGGFAHGWYRFFALRVAVIALLVFVASRVATTTVHYTDSSVLLFHNTFFTPPLALGWVAAACAVCGVAFAIWARVCLGRNWSPAPAMKEAHELVTTGPYAFVRHPIYTGLILMAFGSMLTGTPFGVGVFVIACVVFLTRIKKEERIMLTLFPDHYPAYQKRTKYLVPFVW